MISTMWLSHTARMQDAIWNYGTILWIYDSEVKHKKEIIHTERASSITVWAGCLTVATSWEAAATIWEVADRTSGSKRTASTSLVGMNGSLKDGNVAPLATRRDSITSMELLIMSRRRQRVDLVTMSYERREAGCGIIRTQPDCTDLRCTSARILPTLVRL